MRNLLITFGYMFGAVALGVAYWFCALRKLEKAKRRGDDHQAVKHGP